MQSEVARIRAWIDQEHDAAERALSDFAAVANHASISSRATRLARLVEEGRHNEAFVLWNNPELAMISKEQLGEIVRDKAMPLIISALDGLPETATNA